VDGLPDLDISMRAEFSKATMRAAYARAEGKCEHCGVKLWGYSRPEYHHKLESYLGGANTLDNCCVLCRICHDLTTKGRRPEIDKTRRLSDKHMGIKKRKKPFGDPRYRKKLSGEVVPRSQAAQEHQNHDYDQYHANDAGWPVTPPGAVAPVGHRADQDQDQEDDQDY